MNTLFYGRHVHVQKLCIDIIIFKILQKLSFQLTRTNVHLSVYNETFCGFCLFCQHVYLCTYVLIQISYSCTGDGAKNQDLHVHVHFICAYTS